MDFRHCDEQVKRFLYVGSVIEDKTFGLKNRNKSKVVQKYVQSVTAHAKASVSGGL